MNAFDTPPAGFRYTRSVMLAYYLSGDDPAVAEAYFAHPPPPCTADASGTVVA